MQTLIRFCTAIVVGSFFIAPVQAIITTTGNLNPAYPGTDPWVFGNVELRIGDTLPGTLSITGGSSVSHGHAGIITNSAAASPSSVAVDGVGSNWTASSIGVGYAGVGVLNVSNGGKVTNTTNEIDIGGSLVDGVSGLSITHKFFADFNSQVDVR